MNEMIIKAIIENYSKLSNDELMEKLVIEMAKQKEKDGGANMMSTIEKIKPLMKPEQRKRMEDILASINEDK